MIKAVFWHLQEMETPLECLVLSIETARNLPGAALVASVSLVAPATKAQSSTETSVITVLNVWPDVATSRKSSAAFFRLVPSSVLPIASVILSVAHRASVAHRIYAMVGRPSEIVARLIQSARVWSAQKICPMAPTWLPVIIQWHLVRSSLKAMI